MRHWYFHRTARGRTIAWLLIVAFALLALQPVHVHMVHGADPASAHDAHSAEVHAVALLDQGVADRHDHTFTPLSDNVLKSSGFAIILPALLLGLFILLPRVTRLGTRRPESDPPCTCLFRHRIPPLRAPPRA